MFYYKNGTEFLYVPTFDFYRRSALCNFTPAELPELMPIANIASVISTLVTSLACIGEAYKNNRFM